MRRKQGPRGCVGRVELGEERIARAFQFGILDANGAIGGVACFSDGLFVVAGR